MSARKEMTFPDLPVAPLCAAIVRAAERSYEGDIEAVCKDARLDSRRFRAWMAGEYERVSFRVADRVLTGLQWQWWEVWERGTPAGAWAEAAFLTGDFSELRGVAA